MEPLQAQLTPDEQELAPEVADILIWITYLHTLHRTSRVACLSVEETRSC